MSPARFPQTPQPAVVLWFRIYAGFLCLLYLLLAAGSLVLFFMESTDPDMPPVAVKLMGAIFLVMGLALFATCLVPLVLTPRPWLWTYSLVVICLGMTSACFLPICIPLLIFWLKPEAKQFFGKS